MQFDPAPVLRPLITDYRLLITPPIFTMLVLMALVATGMTGPLLGLSDHLRARHALRTRLI